MRKLKLFKKSFEPEVLEAEEESEVFLPCEQSEQALVVSNDSLAGVQSVKVLDQIEKAGYTAIASKLRDLQATEGVDSLDPLCSRLKIIEQHIDKLLSLEEGLDTADIKRLLAAAVDAHQARTKALLLPYGAVSPRTALQGNKGMGAVKVAIGIGTGVAPRAK